MASTRSPKIVHESKVIGSYELLIVFRLCDLIVKRNRRKSLMEKILRNFRDASLIVYIKTQKNRNHILGKIISFQDILLVQNRVSENKIKYPEMILSFPGYDFSPVTVMVLLKTGPPRSLSWSF